jgi:hypothetical protein
MKNMFLRIIFSFGLLASADVVPAQDSLHHICSYFWKNNLPVPGVEYAISGTGFAPVPFTFFVQGDPLSNCLDVLPIGPGPAGSFINVYGSVETNYLNGVTVIDLQRMVRHILGIDPLPSPYAMIAADANKSGSITTFDVVETRKLLLGIYQELPNAESWRFIPQACTFPNVNNPFAGVNCPVIPSLNPGETTVMVGLKVGDVDGDASPDGVYQPVPTVDSGNLVLPELDFEAGEDLLIPVILEADFLVNAIQVEWVYDTNLLEITGAPFLEGSIYLNTESQSVFPDQGRIRLVGLHTEASSSGDTLFWVSVHTKTAGELQQALAITQAGLQPLMVHGVVPYKINVVFNSPALPTSEGQPGPASFQVRCNPNPFADRTELALNLQQYAYVHLEVFDLTGRRTYEWEGHLPGGKSRLEIPGTALPESGMGVYRLTAGGESVTGRMVRR